VTQTSTADDGTDQAMAVLRAMVDIADSTVEKVTEQLTLTQFRVLRTVAERTPVTMSAVAHDLTLNPSTVTRACDRLESLGLLQRAQNPLNKREVLLAPTPEGARIVAQVDHARREALSTIMRRLGTDRDTATTAFELFATAAAETALPSRPMIA
jgi:DNA-binding MarR family transcriptional regulator